MPSKLVELRPNRHLLDHSFEGYKLSLQNLPHWSHDLALPVERHFPDETQYSFLHTKLFGLHNHLFTDPWDYRYNFYYIDNERQVRRITFENTSHSFKSSIVCKVSGEKCPGNFNFCLSFPSRHLALVSDGNGYMYFLSTDASRENWKLLNIHCVIGEKKYFVILDSRVQEKDHKAVLYVLLQSIEQIDGQAHSLLARVTYIYDEENEKWNFGSMVQLQGKGVVHYAAIETSYEAIYIASDHPFKCVKDSENEIMEAPKIEEKITKLYSWLQNDEDLSVHLRLPENFDKSLFKVSVTEQNIKLSYDSKEYIQGVLKHKVDPDLTTWNVQDNGQVDLLIVKSGAENWSDLIEGGDPKGEQVFDPALVEAVHQRLAHLCSETEVTSQEQPMSGLEECDVSEEVDTVIARHHLPTHTVTHHISLSTHKHLFTLVCDGTVASAPALRHDEDACLWQPFEETVTGDWPWRHQGTLMAFGYVQASKTNRKFLTCSPDCTYSVACESTRHIFIYKAKGQSGELRHRNQGMTKSVKVGQQHVFNIEKYGEVLGVNATNSFLFILTASSLVAIEVNVND